MGEELLQRLIMELLRPLVQRWLDARGIKALVGADQFIYFRKGDIRGRVAPDVFVLPGVRPGRRIKSWKVWQEGVVPSFALEIVSTDADKDYIEAPRLYGEMGVRELVVFDPDWESEPGRLRFQVYRQVPRRGLVRVDATNEDRVKSRQLGCFVRALGHGEEQRLRLATGPTGDDLVPTEAEAERAEKERERAEKERERAEKERERAEKERERTARIAAEEEITRLRREIAQLKSSREPRR